jgi:hypothetical protein
LFSVSAPRGNPKDRGANLSSTIRYERRAVHDLQQRVDVNRNGESLDPVPAGHLQRDRAQR